MFVKNIFGQNKNRLENIRPTDNFTIGHFAYEIGSKKNAIENQNIKWNLRIYVIFHNRIAHIFHENEDTLRNQILK